MARGNNGKRHAPETQRRAVELVRGGMSARDAAASLGDPDAWRSIARWAASARDATYGAGAAPGVVRVPPRAKPAPATPPAPASPASTPNEAPRAPVAPDPPSTSTLTPSEAFEAGLATLLATEDDPTLLDVGELDLLIRLLTKHIGTATGLGDWTALTKLFEFRKLLSLTLKQARPPEKVDPMRDPTNLEALAELRARHAAMREPLEVSPPLVAAMRAHVENLERRLAGDDDVEEVA